MRRLTIKIQNSKFKSIKQLFKFAFLIVALHFVLFRPGADWPLAKIFNLSEANAAAFSLGIYPPIIKIEAKQEANIETPITIINNESETQNLRIVFKPFTAGDSENGEVKYLNETQVSPTISRNVHVLDNGENIETISLAPKQQKKLILKINIGKNEPDSDYYFSVIFMSDPNLNNNNSNIKSLGGIATNVLLTIGKGESKGTIEEFSAPSILERGPVPFNIRIKNTGKNAITPTGRILIKTMFGQTVGKVDLLPVNILAGTIRIIPSLNTTNNIKDITNTTNKKEVNKKGDLDSDTFSKAIWPESFLLGRYTATLTVSLSETGPIYERTVNFFGFPYQLLIGIVIAFLIVAMIIRKVKSRI